MGHSVLVAGVKAANAAAVTPFGNPIGNAAGAIYAPYIPTMLLSFSWKVFGHPDLVARGGAWAESEKVLPSVTDAVTDAINQGACAEFGEYIGLESVNDSHMIIWKGIAKGDSTCPETGNTAPITERCEEWPYMTVVGEVDVLSQLQVGIWRETELRTIDQPGFTAPRKVLSLVDGTQVEENRTIRSWMWPQEHTVDTLVLYSLASTITSSVAVEIVEVTDIGMRQGPNQPPSYAVTFYAVTFLADHRGILRTTVYRDEVSDQVWLNLQSIESILAQKSGHRGYVYANTADWSTRVGP